MRQITLYTLVMWLIFIAPVTANEQIILEIIINGNNIGQQFVYLNEQKEVLVSAEVLKALRLRETLWAGQKMPVALSRLRPNLEFKLDEQASTLVLAVPLEWFLPQNIVREPTTPPPPPPENQVYPQPKSAFLNYQIQANWQEQSDFSDLMLPWEIGINVGKWFASSTFTTRYIRDRNTTETLRQFSSLTWDDPKNLQTLVLGDFNAPYTLLGSGGNYGGISWRKNFRLDNQFKYWPNLDLRTQVKTPSHAEIYSNGRRVEEWEVLPGEVVFDNLGAYAGGDAELVLTDAFGQQTRINVPTMMSQQLLKPGLHEYSYNLGFPRENMGQENADYGKLALLGFHRYGFTDRLTAGFSFALDQQKTNAGPSVTALLGNHGQLEAGTLLSYADETGEGYAAALRYSYNYKAFNFFAGLEGFSRDYTHFGPTVTQGKLDGTQQTHYRTSLNFNYNITQLGSFSVNYSEQQRWDDSAIRQVNLGYRKQFDFGILLWLGARRNWDDNSQNEVFLDLIYYPKQVNNSRFYDNLSYRLGHQEKSGRSQNFSLQKSFPRGPGYGYTFDVKEEDSDVSANSRIQYQNNTGIYIATINRNSDTSYSGNVSAAGGIVWIDGKIHAGRPITDSFAVVQVTGLDNVLVQHQNSLMGVASENDPLLVSELSSYSRNYLSINPQKLPLNYALTQAGKYVEVGQRSGSVVDFKFTRFTAVEGNLYWQAPEGQRMELEALPLEFQVGAEKHESFLGRKGYFYLENIPIGEQLLWVRRAGGDCSVRLTIPDTDKIVANLGELACIPIH